MFDLNRALIAKLCWNVASGVDRGRALKAKYLASFLHASGASISSWCWKGMLKVKNLLEK